MDLPDASLQPRTAELMSLGFKNFDAFHLACAEVGGAEVFCTCDDRLLATASRHAKRLTVRVVDPLELAQEILS
jgi:predicted nucleic acid-binding protein